MATRVINSSWGAIYALDLSAFSVHSIEDIDASLSETESKIRIIEAAQNTTFVALYRRDNLGSLGYGRTSNVPALGDGQTETGTVKIYESDVGYKYTGHVGYLPGNTYARTFFDFGNGRRIVYPNSETSQISQLAFAFFAVFDDEKKNEVLGEIWFEAPLGSTQKIAEEIEIASLTVRGFALASTPKITESTSVGTAYFYRIATKQYVQPPIPPYPDASGETFKINAKGYRVSLYNFMFAEDGLTVCAPKTREDIDPYLEQFKIAEYSIELPFRTAQDGLVIAEDSIDLRKANYARVALQGEGDMTTDSLRTFYWVRSIDALPQRKDVKPRFRLILDRDYFMTDFFDVEGDFTLENAWLVAGQSVQTNAPRIGEDAPIPTLPANTQRKSPIDVEYTGGALRYKTYLEIPSGTPEYSAVAVISLAEGAIRQIVITGIERNSVGVSISNVTEMLNSIARLTSVNFHGSEGYKTAHTLKMYLIPTAWVTALGFDSGTVDGIKCLNPAGSEVEYTENLGTFFDVQNMQGGITVGTYSATTVKGLVKVDGSTEESEKKLDPLELLMFRTPARLIEITGDPSVEECTTVKLIAEPAASGGGSDSLTIYAVINGEFIDISEDFTVDFAVNEEALRVAQQKEVTAIRTVANVVGGIGGVVGGVASGNYFGAVQSAVGAVGGLAEMYSYKKQPAQVKTGGSALNGFANMGLLAFVCVSPSTDNAKTLADLYGYLTPELPYIEFSRSNIPAPKDALYSCLKMKNVEVRRLQSGGNEAALYLKARFEQGVVLQFVEAPKG